MIYKHHKNDTSYEWQLFRTLDRALQYCKYIDTDTYKFAVKRYDGVWLDQVLVEQMIKHEM